MDGYFGTRELPRLLKTLKADYKHELVGERLLTTPNHFAYFKIAEGCDRPCSFCAIPLMRGKHLSTPIEALVKQATGLPMKLDEGVYDTKTLLEGYEKGIMDVAALKISKLDLGSILESLI